jgi:hypothetical protein
VFPKWPRNAVEILASLTRRLDGRTPGVIGGEATKPAAGRAVEIAETFREHDTGLGRKGIVLCLTP